ncbi:HECT-like ubiquitin-conjugating enzyme (E2)-binding protein [Wolffia australiana]
MASVSSSARRSSKRWRYTWEALAHIPTLRLFLFNPEVDPSVACLNLEASLFLRESQLVVKWKDEGDEDVVLRVSVPRILIDPGSSVQAFCMKDHIEVKLALVLPPDHPMSIDSLSVLDEGSASRGVDRPGCPPLSVESDLKSLSGDVHFYCKSCGTKLTGKPSRKFVALPSADWRDVADNWFGGGCCSFGGISEKLVRAYIETYSCAESTCLLDVPSVTISIDDLEGYEFSPQPLLDSGHSNMNETDPKTYGSSHFNHNMNDTVSGIAAEKKTINKSDIFHPACSDEVLLEESISCCAELRINKTKRTLGAVSSQAGLGWLHNVVLGSGFLVNSANLMEDVRWNEFSCRDCSSMLGCLPVMNEADFPVDGGIRLFKCYISTSRDNCASDNVFRDYTVDRIFARLIVDNAADELSFHTVVKDLNTRAPLLQIVLLNSKVWCSSGDCFESDYSGCHSNVGLQPVVKVLFSDNFSEIGTFSRAFEHSDEVFLLNRQANELIESLKLSHIRLPSSCSIFQGMSLSYLER